MLENRKILTLSIGYIIGIFMGLYCKISIVLFYLVFYLIHLIFSKQENKTFSKQGNSFLTKQDSLIKENKNSLIKLNKTSLIKSNKTRKFKLISFNRYFRYIKIIFTKKVIRLIIISSIISNSIVLYQNYRYESLYKNVDNKNIEITGTVVLAENDKYKVKVETKKYKNTYLEVYIKNQEINYGGNISNQNKKISYGDKISTQNKKISYGDKISTQNKKISYGDKICINGKFELPSKRTNYKGFDYSQYLKTKKIYGLVYADKVNILSKNNGNFLLKYTNKLADEFKQIINNSNMKEEEKAITQGILLGDKTDIDEKIIDDFSESNISYILAISGMHISYIIICSSFVFKEIAGKHYSKLITSLIIFIYMCIVNFSPSVVRAGITGIIVLMSNFFYRRKDTWEALSISLLILLIYNPFLLLNVGVQLSFAGTIGIIVFQSTLNRYLLDYLDRVERKAIRRNKRVTKFITKILNTKIMILIKDAILLTISASIAVIPIMAVTFNTVSLTSLVISVTSSFVVGEIVILGLIFIIFKIDLIQKMLSIFLNILLAISKIGERLPLNQIYVVTPNLFEVIIYYFIVFISFYYLKIILEKNKTSFQKRVKNLVSLLKYKLKINKRKIISIILIICIFNFFILVVPKNLRIYFIDVGQGDSCLIVTPKNKTILIDGGGSESFNVRQKYLNAIFVR